MKKIIVIIIVIALLGGGYAYYKSKTKKPGIQVFETALVERGNVRGVLNETGIVKPQVGAQIKVGARATGIVTMMKVKIGDRVKKNELIAIIDDREIRESIEQQEAAIQTAKENLAQVEKSFPRLITEAKANFDLAKANFDRETELLKYEYTTRENVEVAKNKLDVAESVYNRTKEEYASQRNILNATINERKASLKQIKTKQSYTKIYAPMSGIVSDVTARDGEMIVSGLQVANLITIIDPSRLEMWIYIDETDIGRIKLGLEVEYYVDTFPDRIYRGKVAKIYPQPMVKDNIVYYMAIVTISPKDAEQLMPEMTTHVKVVSTEKKDVVIAPNAAIKFESGKQVIYKTKLKGGVDRMVVKTGIMGEDFTEILNGVSAGDEVATKIVIPVDAKGGNNKNSGGASNSTGVKSDSGDKKRQ